ncbi:MAG: hypothetical protein IIX75_00735, partial [Clostridia bacterium]|nr:hypothetical protein [Clostridia bacterium]
KGDCKGTCPKCEAEVRYLEKELEKRQKLGRSVAVVGIAAALAVSSVGCDDILEIPIVDDLWENIVTPRPSDPDHTMGDWDIQGDPATVDGEMLPPFITVSELLSLSETERNQYISGFSKNDIRYEWENEDAVLGDTEDIFYTEDGEYKIIVRYDENGMAISIEIIFWGTTAGDPIE